MHESWFTFFFNHIIFHENLLWWLCDTWLETWGTIQRPTKYFVGHQRESYMTFWIGSGLNSWSFLFFYLFFFLNNLKGCFWAGLLWGRAPCQFPLSRWKEGGEEIKSAVIKETKKGYGWLRSMGQNGDAREVVRAITTARLCNWELWPRLNIET